jgi:very-short-patch-repair endonuclease
MLDQEGSRVLRLRFLVSPISGVRWTPSGSRNRTDAARHRTRTDLRGASIAPVHPQHVFDRGARLEASTRWGVKALKNYLAYAKNGHLDAPALTGREPDSEFEKWVIQMLNERGYEVVPQLGVAGYFIDLAVRDPDNSGTFILGVECDGAMYHSARSVRDRDRLRQEVLVRLGWRIYRIWSTDWFRNPRAEFLKLVAAIEALRRPEN